MTRPARRAVPPQHAGRHGCRRLLFNAAALATLATVIASATWITSLPRELPWQPRMLAADGRGTGSPALPQPQSRWLLFFSGHQGSSALVDMLASLPEVLVPGFEPLDVPGMNQAQKLAFSERAVVEATFTFPADPAAFPAWRRELLPPPATRVNRSALSSFSQLAGKTSAGFKMRPYVLEWGGNRSHTGAAGVSRPALRALLHRYNVSVLLTLRRNRVKEALSWYKARELGVRQFGARGRSGSGGGAAAHGSAVDGSARGTGRGLAATARARSADAEGAGGAWAAIAQAEQQQQQQPSSSVQHPSVPLTINVTSLLNWLNYTEEANRRLLEAAAYYGRPTLTIWYEDFLADPLGQAARAAAHAGTDPRRLVPSARFAKAGPDCLTDAVANFGELCSALRGGPYFKFLEVPACPREGSISSTSSSGDGSSSSSGGGADGSSRGSSDGGSSASAGGSNLQAARGLLANWCAAPDKAASRWAAESDEACMARFLRLRAESVAALRASVEARAAAGPGGGNSSDSGDGSATGQHAGPGQAILVFKHVHKAAGSTLCALAQHNMEAEAAPLPGRPDWTTNCAPLEAFLGPLPALGLDRPASPPPQPPPSSQQQQAAAAARRRLRAAWLGAACWLAGLSPAQLRVLPHHFQPLTFVASEGPWPDAVPLDVKGVAWVTMLRHPLDRTLSSYKWWRFMAAPGSGWPQMLQAECRAYASPPANASLEEWLAVYPDNWMTRELAGRAALYGSAATSFRRPPLTAAHLRLAQQRLHYAAAVLLTDDWGGSAAQMRALFGWSDVDFERHRAGSRTGSRAEAELGPGALAALRAVNEWDLQLYEYAVRLHGAQLEELGLWQRR
eukprot:scaffold9.g3192.t1